MITRLFPLFAVILTATFSRGQQVGDTVIVVAAKEADLKVNGQAVGTIPRGTVLTVEGVSNSGVRTTWGRTGWIATRDLLPIDQAIVFFGREIAAKHRPEDLCARGNAWYETREYDRAIVDYSEAIRRAPTSAEAFFARGYVYGVKGDGNKAIADFTEAVRLDPGFAEAYYCRGGAWLAKSQHEKAILDYTSAIRLDPTRADWLCDRSLAYAKKGAIDRAVADCSEAIRLDARCVDAYMNRSYAFSLMGDYKKAVADLTKAADLDPKNQWIYRSRGDAYARQGTCDRAIADYTTAITLGPSSPCLYEQRGSLLIARGDYERGMADVYEAIRLNPKDQARTFEAWPKAPLSADALRHGQRQVAQMLRDRKEMGRYGKLAEPFCQWAVRKFAGEDLGEEVFWDDAEPVGQFDACHGIPLDETPGWIRVRNACSDRPVATKRSFEQMWCNAVLELYNIASAKEFVRLRRQTVGGSISKEQYVTATMEMEQRAVAKTRSFYIHAFLPWARLHRIATDPSLWYLGTESGATGELTLGNIDRKGAYWRYYEDKYDDLVAWAKNHRKEVKQITEELAPETRVKQRGSQGEIAKDVAGSAKNSDSTGGGVAAWRIKGLDVLSVWVRGALADWPLKKRCLVEPDGGLALGAPYGRVKIAGLTVAEAEAAIKEHVNEVLSVPDVEVLPAGHAVRWQGEIPTSPYHIRQNDLLRIEVAGAHFGHPIRDDFVVDRTGRIQFREVAGSIIVKGLTLEQAEDAIADHLSDLWKPDVSVTLGGWKRQQ